MQLSMLVLPGIVVVLVLLVVGLAAAERRCRLLPVFAISLAVLALGWVLAALAVRSGYRDADGFVDCNDYCSAFQEGVGVTLFYAPVAAVVISVASGVLVALRRRSGAANA